MKLLWDIFHIRHLRRTIESLTTERNHLHEDRARLIAQLFGGTDERN